MAGGGVRRRSYSMLELSDLAELAFRDQGRFQDVTEEEQNTGIITPLPRDFKVTVAGDFLNSVFFFNLQTTFTHGCKGGRPDTLTGIIYTGNTSTSKNTLQKVTYVCMYRYSFF